MGRSAIEIPKNDRTTIVVSSTLLKRVGVHVRNSNDNQTEFFTRAIINQLEREGDYEIRSIMKNEEEKWRK